MQRALKSAYPRSQTEHEPVLQSLQFGVHAEKKKGGKGKCHEPNEILKPFVKDQMSLLVMSNKVRYKKGLSTAN